MWQPRVRFCISTLLLATAGLTVLSGCGSRAYDALLNKRLDQLRAGAPFRSLFAPSPVPDTPITIRVPIAFRESYTEESGHKDDKGRIKPDRFQPPFVKLPGLKMCYEGHTDDPGGAGKLPFYCYLAYDPGGDATKIAEDLQAKLKEKFKDTPEQWEKVDARTPADTALSWRMMRVTGDQEFYVGNPSEAKTLPGIFEVWIHETGEGVMIVAWRTPSSIEGPAPVPTALEDPLAAFTAEPKPDFKAMPVLTAGTLKVQAPTEAPE